MQGQSRTPYKNLTAVVTKGKCNIYQTGDKIIFEGDSIQGKVCPFALSSLLNVVIALRYGAEFPWLKEKDVYTDLACPDAARPVVFEIKRS